MEDFMHNFNKYYSSDYQIDICKMPSYLSRIISDNDNILLIYKKHENTCLSTPVKNKNLEMSGNSVIDLTGSPLKIDSDESILSNLSTNFVDNNLWIKEEELHGPLNINIARKLLNMYNLCPKTLNVHGLFVVCDQSDSNRTVILGSSSTERFLNCHMFTYQGKFSRSDDYLSIQNIISRHNSLCCPRLKKEKTDIEVQCTLEVFGPKINPETQNGCINLEVKWTKPSYEIPDNATVTAVMECFIGHGQSELVVLASDIHLLQKYIDFLDTYRNEADDKIFESLELPCSPSLVEGANTDVYEIIDSILSQYEQVKLLRSKARTVISEENNLRSAISSVYKRSTLDFTEMLWCTLTKCKYYNDLTDCFNYIILEIINGNMKPYVNEDNQTQLAVLIKNIEKGVAIIEKLSGRQPIEMLIEIGFEKITKDYYYIFLTSRLPITDYLTVNEESKNIENVLLNRKSFAMRQSLCPRKSRMSVFPIQKSTNSEFVKMKMTRLAQVHTSLDFLVLAEMYLNLSRSTFYTLGEEILRYFTDESSPVTSYSDLEIDPIQTFRFQIPVQSIKKSYKEKLWKIILTTQNKNSLIKTVFVETLTPLFPPSIFNEEVNIDSKESYDDYYCVHYLQRWNKFG